MLRICAALTVSFDEETTKAFNELYDQAMLMSDGKTNNALVIRSIIKYARKHKKDVEFDTKQYKKERSK